MNFRVTTDAPARVLRSRDPTRSVKVRSAWRSAGLSRLKSLSAIVRTAIIDNDILGLASTSPASLVFASGSAGSVLDAWSSWFNDKAYEVFVGRDGRWVAPYVSAAYDLGIRTAQREVAPRIVSGIDTGRADVFTSLAANELAGITDTLVQQVTRLVADALVKRTPPAALYRAITDRMAAIAVVRMKATVNVLTVRVFNEAKLDAYRSAGISSVGIDPESLPRLRGRDRAVLTARFADAKKRSTKKGSAKKTAKKTVKVTKKKRRKSKRQVEAEEEQEIVEVLTAGDNDVCEDCEDISEAGPYDIDTAQGIIPAHPNCRCAFVPFFDKRFAAVERDD